MFMAAMPSVIGMQITIRKYAYGSNVLSQKNAHSHYQVVYDSNVFIHLNADSHWQMFMTAMSSVIRMQIVITRYVYDSTVLSDWNADNNK